MLIVCNLPLPYLVPIAEGEQPRDVSQGEHEIPPEAFERLKGRLDYRTHVEKGRILEKGPGPKERKAEEAHRKAMQEKQTATLAEAKAKRAKPKGSGG